MESIIFIAFIVLIAYFAWAVNKGEFYPHSMVLFACGMFIMIGINCCSSVYRVKTPVKARESCIINTMTTIHGDTVYDTTYVYRFYTKNDYLLIT